MLKSKVLVSLGTLALLGLLLSACSPAATPAVGAAQVTEAVSDPTAVAPSPEAPQPAADSALTTEETAVDYCLECHIDKQRLIDTADPEEEVISENKGEG